MQFIEALVRQHVEMPPEEIAALARRAVTRTLKRGEDFCRIGQTKHEIGLLHRGVMRISIPDVEGEEATIDFAFPGELVLALEAAVMGEPAGVNISAVTACELSVWPYAVKDEFLQRHAEWARFALLLTEAAYVRKNRRARTLQTEDAAHRYELALKSFPPEFQRVPQYYIASYLGIRPQSLSRIRARIARPRPVRARP